MPEKTKMKKVRTRAGKNDRRAVLAEDSASIFRRRVPFGQIHFRKPEVHQNILEGLDSIISAFESNPALQAELEHHKNEIRKGWIPDTKGLIDNFGEVPTVKGYVKGIEGYVPYLQLHARPRISSEGAVVIPDLGQRPKDKKRDNKEPKEHSDEPTKYQNLANEPRTGEISKHGVGPMRSWTKSAKLDGFPMESDDPQYKSPYDSDDWIEFEEYGKVLMPEILAERHMKVQQWRRQEELWARVLTSKETPGEELKRYEECLVTWFESTRPFIDAADAQRFLAELERKLRKKEHSRQTRDTGEVAEALRTEEEKKRIRLQEEEAMVESKNQSEENRRQEEARTEYARKQEVGKSEAEVPEEHMKRVKEENILGRGQKKRDGEKGFEEDKTEIKRNKTRRRKPKKDGPDAKRKEADKRDHLDRQAEGGRRIKEEERRQGEEGKRQECKRELEVVEEGWEREEQDAKRQDKKAEAEWRRRDDEQNRLKDNGEPQKIMRKRKDGAEALRCIKEEERGRIKNEEARHMRAAEEELAEAQRKMSEEEERARLEGREKRTREEEDAIVGVLMRELEGVRNAEQLRAQGHPKHWQWEDTPVAQWWAQNTHLVAQLVKLRLYGKTTVVRPEYLLRIEQGLGHDPSTRPSKPFLSEEAKSRVLRLTSRQPTDVVTQIDRIKLLGRDFRTLAPGESLNDEIVNCYLKLLCRGENCPTNAHVFSSHFCSFLYGVEASTKEQRCGNQEQPLAYNYSRVKEWAKRQNVDIFERDIVLLPVNLRGTHWALGVVDFRKKRFSLLDSLGTSARNSSQFADAMLTYLTDEHEDKRGKPMPDVEEWAVEEAQDMPQQENGYDCGVFMCRAAECLLRGTPFNFHQRDMVEWRFIMALELEEGKIWPRPHEE